MTTNKLPDVVWLSPSVMRSDGWHMSYIAHALGNSHCYVQKSALDAMTAERDDAVSTLRAMNEDMVIAGGLSGDRIQAVANLRTIISERDSAREALALAFNDAERWRFVQRNAAYQGSRNGYPSFKQAVDAALAAQPETKP